MQYQARLAVLSLLAAYLSIAQALPAAAGGPAVVVIDGSGSMWGLFDGKTPKTYAVRDAMKQLLSRTDRDAAIGLAAFGHRRRSDCGDIEVVSAPAPEALANLGARVDGLSPKGKGPLARSLREAAAALPKGSEQASLIVVTDGPDNCQQDVCAVANDLAKQANPRLAVHVVGLALDPAATRALACISKSTGGTALEARDPASLVASLEQVFTQAGLLGPAAPAAIEAPAPAPVAPDVAATSGPSRIKLDARLRGLETPVKVPLAWQVRDALTSQQVIDLDAPEITQPLPAGTYDVEARLGTLSARTQVAVAEKGLTSKSLEFDAGILRINLTGERVPSEVSEPLTVTVSPIREKGTSAPAGGAGWVGHERENEIVIPSGTYAIAVQQGQSRVEREVTVSPGALATTTFDAMPGQIELAAVAREGGEPLSDVLFTVAVDDPAAPEGRREVARSIATSPRLTLPPGTYYVLAVLGNAEARHRFAHGQGAVSRQTLLLPHGWLSVKASAPLARSAPAAVRVYSLDGETPAASPVATTHHGQAFPLAPGRYRVEAELGLQNLKTSQDIDLPAGVRREIVMEPAAATLALAVPSTSSPVSDPYWEVRDATGTVVWRTIEASPQGLLAPGKYDIRLESRSLRGQTTVELANGETRSVELAPQ